MRPHCKPGGPIRLAVVLLVACLGCDSSTEPERPPPFGLGDYVILSTAGVLWPIDFDPPGTVGPPCTFARDSARMQLRRDGLSSLSYSRVRCEDGLVMETTELREEKITQWTATGYEYWGTVTYSVFCPCGSFPALLQKVILVRGDTLQEGPNTWLRVRAR